MFAHHGAAAYDTSQTTTLKGTVVEFDFINPHCQLFINVPDDGGKIIKWDGEFTNPGTLHRRGWTKEMFKPGDQITLIVSDVPEGEERNVASGPTLAPPSDAPDPRAVRRAFERAAVTYDNAAFLEHEVGGRMLERLQYIKHAPQRILDAGSPS